MIDVKKFNEAAKKMIDAASEKGNSASTYIREFSAKDYYLMNLLLAAKRNERTLQISVSEDSSCADGFFKKTGFDYELNLLHITYPFDKINYSQAAEIFKYWILDLRDEQWLKKYIKSILKT